MKKKILAILLTSLMIATIFSALSASAYKVNSKPKLEPTPVIKTGDLKVWLIQIRDINDDEYMQLFVNIANYKLNSRVYYKAGDIAAEVTIEGRNYKEDLTLRMDQDGFWGTAIPYPPLLLPNPKYFYKLLEKPEKNGAYTVTVKINPNEQMEESNYNNNEKSKTFRLIGTDEVSKIKTTPKTQQTVHPIVMRFLDKSPNAFPLLQQLLLKL